MNRMKQYRIAKNFTQKEAAKALGVSQGTLSGWELGRHFPDLVTLRRLAILYGVDPSALLDGSAPVSSVQAPQGYLYETEREFWLAMRGESMSPQIRNGDTLIVQKDTTLQNGDIAVLKYREKNLVRQVVRAENTVFLRPWNPDFDPVLLDFPWSDEVQIFGKVVEIRRRIGAV